MTTTEARPSDFVLAISVAAVLHVALFLVFVALVATKLLSGGTREEFAAAPEPTVIVEIRPEMFERPKPNEVEEEVKKRLMDSSPDQESEEAPKDAAYIGERNTKEGSELPPDPNALALPSQDGREPRRPGEVETIDSNFQDGEPPDVAMQPESEEMPPPGDPLLKPMGPGAPELEPTEKVGEGAPSDGDLKSELVRTETQVPVPKNEEAEEERDPEMLPKEKESESDPQSKNTEGGVAGGEEVGERFLRRRIPSLRQRRARRDYVDRSGGKGRRRWMWRIRRLDVIRRSSAGRWSGSGRSIAFNTGSTSRRVF